MLPFVISLLTYLAFIPTLLLVTAYVIDGSTCTNPAEIREAVDEALNMATYAHYRATTEKPQVPEVIKSLLGPDGPQLVGDFAALAVSKAGIFKGVVSQLNIQYGGFNGEKDLIISCNDNNFREGPPDESGRREFVEKRMLYKTRESVAGRGLCQSGRGTVTQAFTTVNTDTHLATNPRAHMILCDTGDGSAIKLPFRKVGDSWNRRNWYNVPYDDFSRSYTSFVILHELAHVSGMTDKGSSVIDFGSAGYVYNTIKTLPDQDKARNAQSFAIAWMGMWLRYNTMGGTGSADGKMYKRFNKKVRPGKGPHMF